MHFKLVGMDCLFGCQFKLLLAELLNLILQKWHCFSYQKKKKEEKLPEKPMYTWLWFKQTKANKKQAGKSY